MEKQTLTIDKKIVCQITGLLLVSAADKEVKNKSTSNGSVVVAPLGTQLQQLQTISLPKVYTCS